MRLIRRAVLREILIQFFLYMGLMLVSLAVTWYCSRTSALFTLAGLFFSFLGGLYCIRLSRYWPVDHHPLLQLLDHEPGQVVWVYTLVTERMPYGLSTSRYGLLYFKLIDGEELCISIPVQRLRLVSHYLNRLLPHATFGYSPNKEQLYRINPEMLVQ
jgi:hypothetical protein